MTWRGCPLRTPNNLQPVKRAVKEDDLVLLVAGTGDDVAFIQVAAPGQPQAPGDLAGEGRRKNPQSPGQRVYRTGRLPARGEGLLQGHGAGIRPWAAFSRPQGEVCSFELISPKGEQVFTYEGRTSDFGTAAGEILTQSYWPLGTYTLNMTYGPETPAASSPTARKGRRSEDPSLEGAATGPKNQVSVTFQLQEFKPPRHFVGINFQQIVKPLKGYVNRGEQQCPLCQDRPHRLLLRRRAGQARPGALEDLSIQDQLSGAGI